MSRKTLRLSVVSMIAYFVLPIGMSEVPAFACGPGEGTGMSVNATTGEQIIYCIPAEPTPGFDYNPQTNPDAPPAETTQTREQASAEREANAAASRAAADRAATAAAAEEASRPIIPRVIDPLDPIPDVVSGQKIPGTTVSGQSDLTCPTGSGKAVEVNATTHQESSYCIKNWISPTDQKTIDDQRTAVEEAKAKALTESEAWNKEHPGEQKCFQYSVGNESGGVCANPKTIGSKSNSDTQTATTTEKSNTGASNTGQSDTATAVSDTGSAEKVVASGEVTVKSSNLAKTTLRINLNSESEAATIVATKKGSKTIKLEVDLNSYGNANLTINKNLKGYKVKILVDGKIVDTLEIK